MCDANFVARTEPNHKSLSLSLLRMFSTARERHHKAMPMLAGLQSKPPVVNAKTPNVSVDIFREIATLLSGEPNDSSETGRKGEKGEVRKRGRGTEGVRRKQLEAVEVRAGGQDGGGCG